MAATETDRHIQAYVSPSETIFTTSDGRIEFYSSEQAAESVMGIVEIDSNGDERPLEKIPLTEEQKKELLFLLRVLTIQAGVFSIFQIRNIILTLIQEPNASKWIHILAKQSQPILLALGVVTLLPESYFRIKDRINATEEKTSETNQFLLIVSLKWVTLTAFCLNAICEQIDKADPRIAKAAGMLFALLILVEMLVSGKTSASLSSTNFLSITFFVDFFLKLFIFPATLMQLSAETPLLLTGFFMAMAGFWGIMANALTATVHIQNAPTAISEQASLLHQPSPSSGNIIPQPTESSINSSIDNSSSISIHNPDLRLSTSKQTVWGEFCKRARKVPSYFGAWTEPRAETLPRPGQ